MDRMLTTYDNPYDPFTNFDCWWKEDLKLGHDCCGTLARNSECSPIFSDEINEQLEDEAIDYVVSIEPTIYKAVTKENDLIKGLAN